MHKIKSRSLVVNDPLDPELKQHAAMLIQREEQQLRNRLEKQNQKQARLQAIEKEFVEWADKKDSRIRTKLQKSAKNKEDHINKIVKKCKDHEKFINQKYKNFQTKKKANIKEAWKKAQQLDHSIENYQTIKQFSKDHALQKDKSQSNAAESRFMDRKQIPSDKDFHRQYISASYNNYSKFYSNSSKDYWGELNQSIKQLKTSEATMSHHKNEDRDVSHNRELNNKLKQTIARFKEQVKSQQNEKIQQLGQRLHKIQKTRIKKIKLFKSKKKSRIDNMDYLETEHHETSKKKMKNDRSQRIHSETIMKEKRTHDWSEINKQKRDQFFEKQIQNGTEYLENQKIKYMKTNLAKKIAVSAIQKKLYFQRLNH